MAGEFEAVRAGAMSDAFALLAILVDYPSAGVAEGLLTGAVQRDAASIAREAGMRRCAGGCACDAAVQRGSVGRVQRL